MHRLLATLPASAQTPTAGWTMLDGEETALVTRHWARGPEMRPDAAIAVTRMIEAQAAATPNAPALHFEGRVPSYGTMNAAANRLARWLGGQGIGTNHAVGVCLHRSDDTVIGMLGVLKAGAALMPLDPELAPARLAELIGSAQPRLILTTRALIGCLPAGGAPAKCLDEVDAFRTGDPVDDPVAAPDPDAPVYLLFTSGSTGVPKGVVCTHRGLSNRLAWQRAVHPICAGERMLQKTPFTFDVSMWEMLLPLTLGAALVIARPSGHREPTT
jgi:non-ribosomal peptide synthetase component F